MVGALGVNQALLFTAVFALGTSLAGLGGALQMAREPANLATDLDRHRRRLRGRRGRRHGLDQRRLLAAVIIAEVKAFCIGVGVVDFGIVTINFSKFTLVAEFLVMAVVLVVRPYGLLGRAQGAVRSVAAPEDPLRPATTPVEGARRRRAGHSAVPAVAADSQPYLLDSRHRRVDRGDLRHLAAFHRRSRRHAFLRSCGLFRARRLWRGAIGERLEPADGARARGSAACRAFGALLFGWFAVRLSGVYLAMLTLAFAQIVWAAVFQWEELTGGSNGVIGVWPPPPFDQGWVYYLLTLVLAVICVLRLRRLSVRAVRLCHARRARQSATRRSDRHRRQARALARLCHRRCGLRRGRRIVRFCQGLDLAGDDSASAAPSTASSWCCSAASRR